MAIKSIDESFDYMEKIFSNKEITYKNERLWKTGWPFNWLGFNCLMFDFWDCEEFNEEQRTMITLFQESKIGKDGHNPYHDFIGNSLIGISQTCREISAVFNK